LTPDSEWEIFVSDKSYDIPFESIQGLNVKNDLAKLYPNYIISNKSGRVSIPFKGYVVFDLLNQKLELLFTKINTEDSNSTRKSRKNKPRGKATKPNSSDNQSNSSKKRSKIK